MYRLYMFPVRTGVDSLGYQAQLLDFYPLDLLGLTTMTCIRGIISRATFCQDRPANVAQ